LIANTLKVKGWLQSCKNLAEYLQIDFLLNILWTGFITRGPGASPVHGGPRAAAVKRLTGAAPFDLSGRWELTTGEVK
jgi:hypothetical protein